MASKFSLISTKWFNQIRNGDDFTLNTSDFNTVLTGNTGDVVKLDQQIELSVIYNESQTKELRFSTLDFDATYANLTSTEGDDFFLEGLYPGASLRLERPGGSGTLVANITLLEISGEGNSELKFSDADGTTMISNLAIVDGGPYTDITIKLTSAPGAITYKYGLNPVGFIGESYQSPLDTNQQSYYAKTIPTSPTFQTMAFTGGQNGANLGTVEIAFLSTVDNYRHRYNLKHTLKIPYYVSGQLTNLQEELNPENLLGDNTLRYDGRFEMGDNTYKNSIFPNFGLTGNLGYFGENYNGLADNYTIQNLTISNASGTGVLESTETNTVEFEIVTSGTWNAGIAGILTHSKLPTTTEYQNQTTAYDTIWIFDNIRNTEGGAAASSGIFTDFEFSIQDPTTIAVTVDIDFTADQQSRILTGSNYALYFSIANEDLTDPVLIDRTNKVVIAGSYSRNTDVLSVTDYKSYYYLPDQAFTGQNTFSKFSGGDGDLWGVEHQVTLDTTKDSRIVSLRYDIEIDDGTTVATLRSYYIPVTGSLFSTDGTYNYQTINTDIQGSLNLPSDEPLNRITIELNAPGSPSTTQVATIKHGFQIPHRDWIENLNVPFSFYDIAEPNNNRNEKTSNYSGVSGYVVYGTLYVETSNNEEDVTTTQRCRSDSSTIIDFDAAGWVGFTGTTKLYNPDGEVDYIEDGNDIRIEIEGDHSLGTIALSGWSGNVWMEINGSTLNPTFLSSEKDWTSDDNRLKPTDTLATDNEQFVEKVTVSNEIKSICQTNSDNITADFDYWIKGRFWKLT